MDFGFQKNCSLAISLDLAHYCAAGSHSKTYKSSRIGSSTEVIRRHIFERTVEDERVFVGI